VLGIIVLVAIIPNLWGSKRGRLEKPIFRDPAE
jgi:hypothetical protein